MRPKAKNLCATASWPALRDGVKGGDDVTALSCTQIERFRHLPCNSRNPPYSAATRPPRSSASTDATPPENRHTGANSGRHSAKSCLYDGRCFDFLVLNRLFSRTVVICSFINVIADSSWHVFYIELLECVGELLLNEQLFFLHIFFGSPELFSCQRRLENDLKRRAKMTQTADSKRQRLCAAYTIAGISAGGVVEIPDLTQRPILRYLEK